MVLNHLPDSVEPIETILWRLIRVLWQILQFHTFGRVLSIVAGHQVDHLFKYEFFGFVDRLIDDCWVDHSRSG